MILNHAENEKAIIQAVRSDVFNLVKTPYKYGVVLRREAGHLVDSSGVFRYGGK
jgi:hypothetical protein